MEYVLLGHKQYWFLYNKYRIYKYMVESPLRHKYVSTVNRRQYFSTFLAWCTIKMSDIVYCIAEYINCKSCIIHNEITYLFTRHKNKTHPNFSRIILNVKRIVSQTKKLILCCFQKYARHIWQSVMTRKCAAAHGLRNNKRKWSFFRNKMV